NGVAFNDAAVDGVNGVVPATTDYSWLAPSGVDLPAGITGGLPGSAQADINGILSNSTNGTLAVTYTVTPSNLGCVGTDFRYTVNVYPETTIALTAGSLAQAVCNGNAFVQNDYTVGGTATGVSITTGSLPSGLSPSFNAGVYSITGNPTQSGTFPFELTTTGSSCAEAVLLDTIYVLQDTIYLSSASYTNDQEVCLGDAIDQIEYTTSSSATGVIVNGLPAGYVTNFDALTGIFTIDWTPGVTEAGTYIYTVTTTGPCSGAYLQGTITVNTPIDHLNNTAGSAITICEGTSTTLIGGTILGGNSTKTYLWESSKVSGAGFSSATGINTNADYITTDTLSVDTYFRRTVTSGGCSDTSEEVLVTIDIKPSISIVGGTATICSSETHTVSGVTVMNDDATTYSWTHNGSGTIANATTLTPTYTPNVNDAEKTITLTLTVNGLNSCGTYSTSADYFITINPLPTASISDLTGDVCPNDSITVPGASATNGSILWTSNGVGTFDDATIVSPTYTPGLTDAGSNVVLTMTVSSTVACVPSIAPSVNYIVSVKPLPTEALSAGLDDTLSVGSSIELNPSGSGIVTWDWLPVTGLDNPFTMNPVASPTTTTDYEVTATDLNGCVNVDTVTIVVENDFNLEISNLLTPNGDGKNDTWGIGNLEFYPNTKVTIVNRNGQILYEDDNYANTWDGTYEGKLLPDATYYYIITSYSSSKVYKGSITILSGSSK
ncbi:gliding motility-associated C-terminal domain-containing protein, partial [Crocinitomicaceae bacterium]|nr:gliding motility-associated C-terminal domain-containing protein [Crocinitomicaceae bacterium]